MAKKKPAKVMKKRHIWVVESRDKKNDGTWSRWQIGEGFSNRKDAVFGGAPYKDDCGEVRIVRYDSTKA